MKPRRKNNKNVQQFMKRMDSATSQSVARDRRIIERATNILNSTKNNPKQADQKLKKLLEGQKRSDGWMNFATGMGIRGKDKRTANMVYWQPLEEVICEQVYGGDKIGRRMVEMLPDDEFRQWITFKGLDPAILKQVNKDLDRMKARERMRTGRRWARLYGGAGTLMNVDDGAEDLTEPLNLNNVQSLKSLWTFGRFELEVLPSDVEYDLDNENFGQPNLYMLVPRNRTDQSIQMQKMIIKFHHTRILRWDGMQLPRRIEITNRYWGDSVLSPFIDSLRDYKGGVASLAHILQDFRTLVVKIKGLADTISSGGEEKVQSRVDTMNYSRSVLGAILLDAEEEEATYMNSTLTGVNEVMEQIKSDVGSNQDAPKIRLFNDTTPGKLGDDDEKTRDWYDHVKSSQEMNVRPNLLRLMEVYFSSKEGPTAGVIPDDWSFTFNSLWQQTEKEIAETRKATAETDEIYMAAGVLGNQEVRTSRFGGDEYSSETTLDPNLSATPMAEETDEPGIPSNLDPDTKMNPPADAGTSGTLVSPESLAHSASSQSSVKPTTEEKDQFGSPKSENYVKNLYSTFIQDGKKVYRLDGAPMHLKAVFVSKEVAKTREDAIAGLSAMGIPIEFWKPQKSGWLFKQKALGNIELKNTMVKKPMYGVALYFGKPSRIGQLT